MPEPEAPLWACAMGCVAPLPSHPFPPHSHMRQIPAPFCGNSPSNLLFDTGGRVYRARFLREPQPPLSPPISLSLARSLSLSLADFSLSASLSTSLKLS